MAWFRHGAQNAYDSPSHSTLENEFGTHNEDECMIKILEGGTVQISEVSPRWPILLLFYADQILAPGRRAHGIKE